MPNPNPKTAQTIVQQRLAELLPDHPQADIARKTGTSAGTVWKYLQGTKAPLEFGSALVEGLGVNPAWLLTGEGSKYLSDVTADTAATAGHVLELVQAMNAVAKKRLGALLGKDHLVKLRELDEALTVYEKMRAQINERFVGFHRQLVDDFQDAATKAEIDRAMTLRSAIRQISRFSDDRDLDLEFRRFDAYLEHYQGNVDRALEIERDVFLPRLFQERRVTEDSLIAAVNLIISLHFASREEEALDICRAVLGLLRRRGASWQGYKELEVYEALFELDIGELAAGLRHFFHVLKERGNEDHHDIFEGVRLRFSYFAEILPFSTLRALPLERLFEKFEFVKIACLEEDVALLRRGVTLGLETQKLGMILPRALLAVFDGKAAEGLRDFETYARSPQSKTIKGATRDLPAFLVALGRTQLLRLAKKTAAARKALEECDALLCAVGPDICVDLLWRANHYRNALALIPADSRTPSLADLRARAAAFFEEYESRGYRAFRKFAERK